MNQILKVAKWELYRYFISPLAYVYLICFLALNASLSLYFGEIFTSGNASLKPMFEFLPWIFLIFTGGIAMRLWAEELKSGTILQIMTLPISLSKLVWGKFLAAWSFCTIGLFLTFPFVITLNVLGSPDNWVIVNSYFGAFLLIGAMLAIAQSASCLTNNQVIALVIGFVVNLLFLFSGLEYVLGFFRGFCSDEVLDMIASFSFLTHMGKFSLGIFELRALVFLLSVIALFNELSILLISYKSAGYNNLFKITGTANYVMVVLLIGILFFGFNLLSNSVLKNIQMDFTQEKLFTVADGSKKVLQNLPSNVTAKVYYSPILGQRDKRFSYAFENLKLLLEKFKNNSDGKFRYKIYNPEPLSEIEDRAINAKLWAIPVSDINVSAYFGIVLTSENGFSKSMNFLPLERQSIIEQDIIENIYLLEKNKKKLGVLSSLPVLGAVVNHQMFQSWKIMDEIQKYYDVITIATPEDIKKSDVLMMVHPQEMPKELEKAIYDYSISGGKILAFFDVAAESLRFAAPQNKMFSASDYGKLPELWGFYFYQDKVIADLDNSSEVEIESNDYNGTTQDLIQVYLTKDNFYTQTPEVKNLKRILVTSVSGFMPRSDADVYFIPLMKTSKQSQFMSAEVVTKMIHPSEILRHFRADKRDKYVAAHIISKQKDKPFDVIVVGDADMLYDSFWTTYSKIGNNEINVPLLDNSNFVLNALDVLSKDDELTSLRGKGKIYRPFRELEKEQKQILRKFKVKEKDVFDEIIKIKKGLNEIWSKKEFENRKNFTADELSIINKVKNKLEQKRKELYEIRKEILSFKQKVELLVKLFNIYTIPGILILFLIIKNIKRKKQKSKLKISKNMIYLAVVGLGLAALGFMVLTIKQASNDIEYEDKLLFPELEKNINDVNNIKIMGQNKNVTLQKDKNGTWKLLEHPEFRVKQKRIKSFLAAILQARIYEKRADRLENLEKFGLLPVENAKSKAIEIVLQNQKAENVIKFWVGDYNIELGRGANGAYIRLPDKFQIWLSQIELVDLDLDYHNWVYANLWDLSFGRLSKISVVEDEENLAKFVAEMLNIKLYPVNEISELKFYKNIVLNGENFSEIEMKFYKNKDKVLVKIINKGEIKTEILREFINATDDKFFEIAKTDLEKLFEKK